MPAKRPYWFIYVGLVILVAYGIADITYPTTGWGSISRAQWFFIVLLIETALVLIVEAVLTTGQGFSLGGRGVRRDGTVVTPTPPKSTEELELPLLNALFELGGKADRELVWDKIYQMDILDSEDFAESNGRIRWHIRLEDTRTQLITLGDLTPDSSGRIWEISSQGRGRIKKG